MANLQSFLDIEAKMMSLIWNKVSGKISKAVPLIAKEIDKGNKKEAEKILNSIDFSEEVKEAEGELDLILVNCLMYGSSLSAPLKESRFLEKDGLPTFLLKVRKCFSSIIEKNARNYMREQGMLEIEKYLEENKIQKAVDKAFAASLNDAVLNGAKVVNDIGANLMTSRLVSYGFLAQASVKGIKTYQLQAVLDNRTSPVCKRLNGKVFRVEASLEFLEEILQVTDPDQLAVMSPFVSGNKASLHELENLTASQLQARGVMVPPFHPFCRTILVMVGEAKEGKYTPVQILISEKEKVKPFDKVDSFYKWAEKNKEELTTNNELSVSAFQLNNGINKKLRTTSAKDLDKSDRALVRQLDSAIKAHEATKDIVTYRAVKNLSVLGVSSLDDLIGATLRDKAYISTSALEKNALKAAKKSSKGIIIEMIIPAGANYIVPNVYTDNNLFANEAELVLGRNSKFRIDEVIPKYKKVKTATGYKWLPKIVMRYYK